jgi:hypothetical protein
VALRLGMSLKSAKAGFFDRKTVVKAVDRATRKVLSRFGAFVRTTARSSIRRRKTTSKPGQPPTSWTGLLKRFLFFSYEPARRSVVIGPVRLGRGDGEAPRLLEHGGTVARRGRRRRRRVLRYRARPYMGPAFEKEKPKLPTMWRDSVR